MSDRTPEKVENHETRINILEARLDKVLDGANRIRFDGSTTIGPPQTHAHDAADIGFTPAVLADWTGAADPGDVNDALDELALRVTDEEWHTHAAPDAADVTYTPAVLTDWDLDADPGDVDNALNQLAERVDDIEAAAGHDAVTLDANADTLLSLAAQVLGLDVQNANKVFAGPTTGADAVPTFRTLVAADVPGHDHTTADATGPLTNDEHDGYSLYTEIATPSAPAANKMSLYGKDIGGRTWLHFLSEAGPERAVCANAHTHSGTLNESSAINPATLDLPAAASPSQTADGRIVWDSDDNLLTIGDGSSRQTFYPLARSYSRRQYVFVPDAAAGVTIVAGDAQGPILHSGPNNETADALEVDAETAPGASGLPITVQYGDTNDLDTVASWTTIATLTLSSEKSSRTTSMTNATVTAARLLRMNVGTIVGTPKDCTVTLHTKAPLVA